MCVAEKVRLQNPRYAHTRELILASIHFFEGQIALVDEEMSEIINKNDVLRQTQEIIESVVGIGKKTAQALIGSLPELGKLDNKKIASLVGVAPIIRQSGQYKGFAKIEQGRKVPRQALYLAALSAIRFNPIAKAFYQRLRAQGKKGKVAIVAVMRKLLVILNTMIQKKEMWNPRID